MPRHHHQPDTPLTAGLSVSVLLGDHSHLDRGWHRDSFNEPYVRLYLVLSGRARIHHHDAWFDLLPGMTYLIPPRSNLHHECSSNVEILWFHALVHRTDGIDLFELMDCNYAHRPAHAERVADDIHEIIRLYKDPAPAAQLAVHGRALALLAPFIREPVGAADPGQCLRLQFIPVLELINANLAHPPTLDELARRGGYGRNHFARRFKEAFAMAPLQYLQRQRIGLAQQRLRQEPGKLETLARELGFHDAFHFSRAFKRVTGVSPAQYRRQLRQPTPP